MDGSRRVVGGLVVAVLVLAGCIAPASSVPPSVVACSGPSSFHAPGPTAHPGCVDPWEVGTPCLQPAAGEPVPECLRP